MTKIMMMMMMMMKIMMMMMVVKIVNCRPAALPPVKSDCLRLLCVHAFVLNLGLKQSSHFPTFRGYFTQVAGENWNLLRVCVWVFAFAPFCHFAYVHDFIPVSTFVHGRTI